jgi:hypothetical protein
MSPEEYRRHLAKIDPEYEAPLRRREAQMEAQAEAELKKMKDEPADGGEPGI